MTLPNLFFCCAPYYSKEREYYIILLFWTTNSNLENIFYWIAEYSEYEMCVLIFTHCTTNQKDVCAELQDAVHTGQLLKHDGMGDLTGEATYKLSND